MTRGVEKRYGLPSKESSEDGAEEVQWSSSMLCLIFFFSSRRRHTRYWRDWSSDVCSSDLLIALLLVVPTVVLVELRLPRLRPLVEFLTLVPLLLPPIALVVGVRSVLAWAPDHFYGTPLAEAFFALQEPALPWILVLVYVVLALPFVYRALDAGVRGAQLRTLTEAARVLGASWPRVMATVVLPVLRTSVLNAAFLTLALVLGEFTVAAILGFETFPTWIVRISGSQPQLSVAVSVLSLLLTWALLLLISALDRRRREEDPA